MLPTIISKLGLPVLISLLGGALGRINNPVAQSASKSLENFEGALAGGVITAEQMAEANRHAEELAKIKAKEYETALSEVNQSIRAELSSTDAYVRRMRPTFGYLMAITWAAQMMALAYVVVFDTDKAKNVLEGMESLTTIWAVGLSVLGIYVYKRSEEKKSGILSNILKSSAPKLSAQDAVPKTTNVKTGTPTSPKLNN